VKTNPSEALEPRPTDWDSLPSVEEINSEDAKRRREAEEKAFRILWEQGIHRTKVIITCSHDEAENIVQEAIIGWLNAVRKL